MLAAAAALGLVIGACWPAWHVALEPAQLLAGVVDYPQPSPFQLYETRVWNLWHQLLAPLLAAGMPERTLSIALSGVVVSVAFAALSGFARALGAGAALSLAAPFLVLVNGSVQDGLSYPILFIGQGHTYGMVGLSWLALSCAVLAAERWRAGGLLLGLSPALHASLGGWLWIAAALAALADPAPLRPNLRALVGGAALGVALAAASLALHWTLAPPAPPIEAALADRYLDAFLRLWDAHRQPADVGGRLGFVIWCDLLVALALLRCAGSGLVPGQALVLRILVLCGAVGYAGSFVSRYLPVGSLPGSLSIAMPTRLGNLVALLSVPLALAALWRFRRDTLARGLLVGSVLLFGSLLLLVRFSAALAWALWLGPFAVPLLALAALVAVVRGAERTGAVRFAVLGLLGWLAVRSLWYLGFPDGTTALALLAGGAVLAALGCALAHGLGHGRLFEGALALALAAIVVWGVAFSVSNATGRAATLYDWTNRPALAEAARGEGPLLVGPLYPTMQLRTRRPLLLDPTALDMLPYALAAGPALETILRDAYGIEFFAPPPDALHKAALPAGWVRAVWERRTPDEWRRLRASLGVTDVLADPRWRLQLEARARDPVYALYRLPE